MKPWFHLSVLLLASLFICPGAFAQEKPLTDKELKDILESLEKIRGQLRERNRTSYDKATKTFQTAAGSPVKAYDFYLRCRKELDFKQKDLREADWRTWRESNVSWLRSSYHMKARQLQLQYLILTIKASMTDDLASLVTPLTSFVDDVTKLEAKGYQYLNESINDCHFARAYQLTNILQPAGWSMTPLDIENIFESTIFPILRKKKDPRLPGAWDSLIRSLTKLAEMEDISVNKDERAERLSNRKRRGGTSRRQSTKKYASKIEEFREEKLPEIRWEMCEDLLAHEFQDTAIRRMLETIKDHSKHRDVNQWMVTLEKALNDALGNPTGGES
ncbi:MAG: hypothetical protein AAF514_03290 [Verrucomicrobiota bacterium]